MVEPEYSSGEIARAIRRLEESQGEIKALLEKMSDTHVTRSEWALGRAATSDAIAVLAARVSGIEIRQNSTGARVVNVIGPIIAGVAVIAAMWPK